MLNPAESDAESEYSDEDSKEVGYSLLTNPMKCIVLHVYYNKQQHDGIK